MSDDEGSRSSPVRARSESPVGSPEPKREKGGGRKRPRVADPDEDDDVKEDILDDSPPKNGTASRREDGARGGNSSDIDADGDEEEDEEDDEEDDDDDEEDGGRRKGKKRKRKTVMSRFLDVEAEVDDEDDEDEQDDDFADVAEFIEEGAEEPSGNDREHRKLDQRRGEAQLESVEETVARLKQRYGRAQGAKYDPDSDQVPQRLLMPGNGDPSLWQVRVKAGEEQNLITKIFRKVFSAQYSANPFEIFSAFYRNSLPGMLFVEARSAAPVLGVLSGLVGAYLSTPPKLVPVEEMAPLLKIKKKDENIQPGMWVRMKRGKHAGDLAQVIDVDQITNGVAGIKFIPRIDLTPRDKRAPREKGSNGKALGGNVRPPARLFAYDDVKKVYNRNLIRQTATTSYLFDGDEFIDGFCFKDVKLNLISAEGVKPTLEEVSRFTGEEGETSKIDLSAIADANRDIGASGLFPGDRVEVHEGEQSGLYGPVVTVTIDVIAIQAMNGDVRGQIIEVPSRSVRKRFEVGEHVKVLNGPNRDASGMVVDVKNDVVTLMSDQGEQEIKAFSKDVRKAADTAGGTQAKGIFDLHDMVMIDSATAAVVIKVEGAMLRIMDQNGAIRVVTPHEVTARRDNKNFAVAQDSVGHDMKVGDAMKEIGGENRTGDVLNIFRSIFVFLFSREILDNFGVFVARAPLLISVTPKATTANDLSKLNPSLQSQLPYGGASLMAPPSSVPNKNRLINTTVVIIKGTQKGLMGIIKDVQGEKARVEMASNNKVLTIDLTSLKRKDTKSGMTYPLDTASAGSFGAPRQGGNYDINPYGQMESAGGATPAPNYGGRTPGARFGQTPNPYAGGFGGGKTPNPYASGAGGRTPAPGAGGGFGAGGKTPGWAGGGGKTPAPGAGGYGGTGGRTPAPGYGGGDGGKTPGWAGGGRTPNPSAFAPPGGRTPAPGAGMYQDPGTARKYGNGGLSAPTPYTAPPTGMGPSVPTPAGNPYSAPTPYAAPTPYSAPTPYAAPTPSAAQSAPTPGANAGSSQYSAPTPYGAPTPYAAPAGPSRPSNGSGAPSSDLPWDWALDFRNIRVEVGVSSLRGTRNPLHFQRGAFNGQQFGYADLSQDEIPICVLLSDPSVTVEIPSEYLGPVRPNAPGQLSIVVSGPDGLKGQQRATDYLNEDQWMMVPDPAQDGTVPMIVPSGDLCRIWNH